VADLGCGPGELTAALCRHWPEAEVLGVDSSPEMIGSARLDLLAREGCVVDAWETTYPHVLTGAEPVLKWHQGAGLRPIIAGLDPDHRAEFMAQYGALLRDAYPQAPYGTVLPFRRVFVVAHRR